MDSISHYFLGPPHNFASREYTKYFFNSLFPNIPVIQPLQVHGSHVVQITQENMFAPIEADGIWTTESRILLSVKTADCIGLLFYHPNQNIIGAIHAGWRGLAKKISIKFLQKFNISIRKEFKVILSPSLGKCCAKFSDPFHETPEFFHPFITSHNNTFFVDLWKVAISQLQECGIKTENITLPTQCTQCSQGKWWSHRNKNTERNISVIGIDI